MNYRVYADNYLIYESLNEKSIIFDPNLELELNKVWTFEFTIYADHPYFDKLNKLKTIITIFRNDELIFRGRILNDVQGFYNQKQVSCEGELAFLNDTIQRPYDFMSGDKHTTVEDLFSYFIKNHNAQVDSLHQFKIGNVTVSDSNDYIVRSESAYTTTWDAINDKLINILGGYLWVRHEAGGNYIDYLEDFSELNKQPIEFGSNLLDLTKEIRGENIATALIPIGATVSKEVGEETIDETTTISTLEDYETDDICKKADFIYSKKAVEQYGWIYTTNEWDDVTQASNLLEKAVAYLQNAMNLDVTIELSAVDLSVISENDPFMIGKNIQIFSKVHELNTMLLIKRMNINLSNPESNSITVGTVYKTFTEESLSSDASKVSKEIAKKINRIAVNLENNDTGIRDLKVVYADLKSKTNQKIEGTAQEILNAVGESYFLKVDASKSEDATNTTIKKLQEEISHLQEAITSLQNTNTQREGGTTT